MRHQYHLYPKTESPLWVLIFLDMLSLMLSFFILLFSMSEIKKTTQPHENDPTYFPKKSSGSPLPPGGIDQFKIMPPPALNLDYLQAVLLEKLKAINFLKDLRLVPFGDRLILSLPSDLVFTTARADLKDDTKTALYELAHALSTINNRVHIYGYTDARPVRGGDYISNWELSMARALSVEHALRVGGYAQHLVVQGFAETNPLLKKTLTDAMTPNASNAENVIERRVDIVIFQTGV